MSAASASFPSERSRAFRAILWGGLMAGAFDIIFAFVFYGLKGSTPIRILQSVASGLLGKDAFNDGTGTAALGMVCHFLIAFGAAAVYYAASRSLRFLVRRAVVCGLLYGILVYLFMNFVVLPLSAIPFKPSYPLDTLLIGIAGHMLLIGLPISLATRRYSN
jgi:uncharacterized membrane protein YagU involved in acid resistance